MFLLALSLLSPSIGLTISHHRGDQWRVFEQRREGRILSLREIEGRVVPTMRGADYLGFEFDGGSAIYTLKFVRDGAVIWVEVDGRSGQILGRSR
jgi:uncharacterized membrane protein YkoI